MIDATAIYNLTEEELVVLPAYEFTFNFYYLENLSFKIGCTNKHMEIYSHFQSSTLSEIPYLIYGFSFDLN